jgi:hypothetical protein
MAAGAVFTASTISVQQALVLLDGHFAGLSEGISVGRYAFWIGSGVSRERVDTLKGIIERVLSRLQNWVDAANANCAYQNALAEAIDFAQLSIVDRAQIDFTRPTYEWPVLDTILSNLIPAYSRLLDIRVAGHIDADYLLWEAVDVPGSFAPTSATPDCEHICLAVLALEGVLPEVARGRDSKGA